MKFAVVLRRLPFFRVFLLVVVAAIALGHPGTSGGTKMRVKPVNATNI